MRVVLQRVKSAAVLIEDRVVSKIGRGVLLLVGFSVEDAQAGEAGRERIAKRLLSMRIFEDESGKMNRSVTDIDGEVLVVSQFTLTASLAKGARPSFHTAANSETAIPLFESFVNALRREHSKVFQGVFGAAMQIELVNDGPVTFVVDG